MDISAVNEDQDETAMNSRNYNPYKTVVTFGGMTID